MHIENQLDLEHHQIQTRLTEICQILRQRLGQDFRGYKESTLVRRIQRRMRFKKLESTEDYLELLKNEPDEAQGLLDYLIVSVTQFFREPQMFEVLAREVIRKIVETKPVETAVRVWVPGCATGEEAYSIAMLLAEAFADAKSQRHVQIFATDIDTDALAQARAGIYPEDISEDVSPERLRRFFSRQGENYKISPELRSMCVFATHNLLSDPPFSHLDLISCRNLLIYLDANAQRQLIPIFHQCLSPNGCLVLGPSETISTQPELFAEVDLSRRIFRRREHESSMAFRGLASSQRGSHPVHRPKRIGPAQQAPPTISQTFERMVLEQFSPACAMINVQGDILHTAGQIAKYLQVSAGPFSNNIFHLAGGDLKHELRVAIHQAMRSRGDIVRHIFAKDAESESLMISVHPLSPAQESDGLFTVAIQPLLIAPHGASAEQFHTAEKNVAHSLEEELRATKVELQHVVEQLESSNEELAIANEELISTNEELESANEELISSQEELESSNEALRANDQVLRTVTDGARVGLSMLDTQHRYVFANNAYKQIFGLGDRDIVGEKIADVLPQVYASGTRERLLRAQTGEKVRSEVEIGEDLSFIVSIESKETSGQPPLLIASIVETTEMRRSQKAAVESAKRLRDTLDNMMEGCQIIDFDYRYTYVNPSAASHGRRPAADLLGLTMMEAYPGIEETEIFRRIRDAMENREPASLENEFFFPDGASAVFQLSIQPVPDGVVIFSSDITERYRAAHALLASEERLRLTLSGNEIATWEWDAARSELHFSPEAALVLRVTPEMLEKHDLSIFEALLHPDDVESIREMVIASVMSGNRCEGEYRIIDAKGEIRWVAGRGQSYLDASGKLIRIVGTIGDITRRKKMHEVENEHRATIAHLSRVASVGEMASSLAHELNQPLTAIMSYARVCMAAAKGRATKANKEAVSEHLEEISSEAMRAAEIVRRVRAFIRKQAPHQEEADINALVRDSIDLMRFEFKDVGIMPELHLDPKAPAVTIDSVQIQQVLINLLQNALDAMDETDPAIRSLSVHTEINGKFVHVQVRDTGSGITPEAKERVFESFFTTKAKGLGLGLAICRSIIEAHGGQMSASSREIRGTIFEFILPIDYKSGKQDGRN